MMKTRTIVILLFATILVIMIPILVFTWARGRVAGGFSAPTATSIVPTPTPLPTAKAVLTMRGTMPVIQAKTAYLVDVDTGNILVNINGYKPLPMASITKIMTALIAIESGKLDQPVTVMQSELDQVPSDASSAQLVAGEMLTLKDLLYGLMLPSGDDAALVIADTLGGTTNNFVRRMNLFALRLRLFQTHYTNPHGLNLANDQEHYSSASDIARLTEYAMRSPVFTQIVETQDYKLSATDQHTAHNWVNTNTLLESYAGMIGVKTGHTDAAGWCLVFAASRDGHHLIGVVMNDASQEQRDQDTATLLNWGFALPMLAPVV